jgi:hypothetical protein
MDTDGKFCLNYDGSKNNNMKNECNKTELRSNNDENVEASK